MGSRHLPFHCLNLSSCCVPPHLAHPALTETTLSSCILSNFSSGPSHHGDPPFEGASEFVQLSPLTCWHPRHHVFPLDYGEGVDIAEAPSCSSCSFPQALCCGSNGLITFTPSCLASMPFPGSSGSRLYSPSSSWHSLSLTHEAPSPQETVSSVRAGPSVTSFRVSLKCMQAWPLVLPVVTLPCCSFSRVPSTHLVASIMLRDQVTGQRAPVFISITSAISFPLHFLVDHH